MDRIVRRRAARRRYQSVKVHARAHQARRLGDLLDALGALGYALQQPRHLLPHFQVGHAAEDEGIPVGDRLVEAEFVIEKLFHGEIEFDEVDADEVVAGEDVPEKGAAESEEEKDSQQVPPGKGEISLKGVRGISGLRIRRQGTSRILKMNFLHNQIPPQSHELFRGFDEAREIEELGLAVGAMVMVNRHFFESEP